ncbi:MAG: Transposase [Candidatus Midichloria mitochondrii]|uniref:Uncharacterized protein n=1 Tax=Midichloria mitochondrii (strain IricVA) TaxID=696127 RepID=F7XUA0_MIDMI|nr:hypothetical protein midi_01183 [Candidatus Midichloria mitochondrii IricVA]
MHNNNNLTTKIKPAHDITRKGRTLVKEEIGSAELRSGFEKLTLLKCWLFWRFY